LLNQRQKILLRFQRKYLVETSSSSEESDYEAKNDTVRLMDSSNPFIRLATFSKLKKVVTSYKDDELDKTDRRILRGLFRKNLKDFDEKHEQSWKKLVLQTRMKSGLEATPGNVGGIYQDMMKKANNNLGTENNNNPITARTK
jgi:hypothetical protein